VSDLTDKEMAKYRAKFSREELKPTDDKLKAEAAGAAQTLAHVWDGEVQVLVAMTRRDSNIVAWAVAGTQDRERLLAILRRIWDSSSIMNVLLHGEGKK
jgi:hypothetical protein